MYEPVNVYQHVNMYGNVRTPRMVCHERADRRPAPRGGLEAPQKGS